MGAGGGGGGARGRGAGKGSLGADGLSGNCGLTGPLSGLLASSGCGGARKGVTALGGAAAGIPCGADIASYGYTLYISILVSSCDTPASAGFPADCD